MLIGGLESAGHGSGADLKGFVVDGFSRHHGTFSDGLNLFVAIGVDSQLGQGGGKPHAFAVLKNVANLGLRLPLENLLGVEAHGHLVAMEHAVAAGNHAEAVGDGMCCSKSAVFKAKA